MSNQQDKLDSKLSDAKETAERLLNQRRSRNVEVVKKRSVKDYVLWLLAIVSGIAATQVNSELPGYWAPASDVWVRLGIIIALLVFAFVCLIFTSHGSDFKVLVKDAAVELRRVTWPTKGETIHWTWLSIVFMILFGILVWALDFVFNQLIGFIIG